MTHNSQPQTSAGLDTVPFRLSQETPLFFLHIPKTAGTSFTTIFDQYFHPDEMCPHYEWWELFAHPLDELAQYRYIAGHFGYNVTMLLPQMPTVFTFLRDPIERVLSHLNYLKNATEDDYWAARINDRDNFRKFIMAENPRPMVNNMQTRFIAGPQTPVKAAKRLDPQPPDDVMADIKARVAQHPPQEQGTGEEMLALAKERLRECAFVGLTERFNESMHLLAYTLGWQPITQQTRRRKASNRLQWDDLDADLQERLLDLNALDIALYEYAQELFDERYAAMQQALLTQHYQQQFRQHFTPTDTADVSLAHVLPGSGWHAAETSPVHGIYRWMGPDPVAYVDVPLQRDKPLQLRVTVVDTASMEILQSLRAFVDDEPVALTGQSLPDDAALYTGVIPAQPNADGRSRITLRVSETVPENPEADAPTRRIGLAISRIQIMPHDAS